MIYGTPYSLSRKLKNAEKVYQRGQPSTAGNILQAYLNETQALHKGKRLEIAEVVESRLQTKRDQVFFGATVTYADARDHERTVRILGVDEARSDQGEISWISPVARALMRAFEGDVVDVRTPAGIERIEVLEISYQDD